MRYNPSYNADGGKLCSARLTRTIGSWEMSYVYDTLHKCCDVSFTWDYDAACMTTGNNDVLEDHELNLLNICFPWS
jgi:hypothetical protein